LVASVGAVGVADGLAVAVGVFVEVRVSVVVADGVVVGGGCVGVGVAVSVGVWVFSLVAVDVRVGALVGDEVGECARRFVEIWGIAVAVEVGVPGFRLGREVSGLPASAVVENRNNASSAITTANSGPLRTVDPGSIEASPPCPGLATSSGHSCNGRSDRHRLTPFNEIALQEMRRA
jgi:hypothetical protein